MESRSQLLDIIVLDLSRGSNKMTGLHVFIIVGLFLPSNSVLFNRTYGNLEFISPGDTRGSFSFGRSWCKQHGRTLAEIMSERIWNLTLLFVHDFLRFSRTNYEFDYYHFYPMNRNLNANGKELPAWQWISGETFADGKSYPLRNDREINARLSSSSAGTISINGSLRTAMTAVGLITFVNMWMIPNAGFKVSTQFHWTVIATLTFKLSRENNNVSDLMGCFDTPEH